MQRLLWLCKQSSTTYATLGTYILSLVHEVAFELNPIGWSYKGFTILFPEKFTTIIIKVGPQIGLSRSANDDFPQEGRCRTHPQLMLQFSGQGCRTGMQSLHMEPPLRVLHNLTRNASAVIDPPSPCDGASLSLFPSMYAAEPWSSDISDPSLRGTIPFFVARGELCCELVKRACVTI